MEGFLNFKQKMQAQIGRVIIGKEAQIEKILLSLICGGHVLLEDVPGVGKTKLSKTLAKSLGLGFKRIQFTPDLLPGDLTGIYYFNQETHRFEYREGPLKTNLVLADEINRATPRTQSALLECMEEGQISVEGHTMALDMPFFVMATQNPIEQFGTFPLPEAQLDRFFMRIQMGYPSHKEEMDILSEYQRQDPLDSVVPCSSKEELLSLQQKVMAVFVHEDLKRYMVDLCRGTRMQSAIKLGASTRALLALQKGVKAKAALQGRDYVIPEDVKEIFVDMMAHRLVMVQRNENRQSAISSLTQILKETQAPVAEDFGHAHR